MKVVVLLLLFGLIEIPDLSYSNVRIKRDGNDEAPPEQGEDPEGEETEGEGGGEGEEEGDTNVENYAGDEEFDISGGLSVLHGSFHNYYPIIFFVIFTLSFMPFVEI
ncbi:hypothetical protein AB6A40_005683 [Gnathostoma spinigerum]|uniref:Glycine-rich protein n=1 Tax=Gnathostoma spinigerum TaxID=75299 RepID=A0ABD6EG56_9BILA